MQFISEPDTGITPEEETSIPTPPPVALEKPPEGYKYNPLYLETKSKKLQLLMQPSLLERIREQAAAKGSSVNDYIHKLLDKATQG